MTEFIRLKTPIKVKTQDLYPNRFLPPDNTVVLVMVRGSRDLKPATFTGLSRGIPQFISIHSGVNYDPLGWMPLPELENPHLMEQKEEADVAN